MRKVFFTISAKERKLAEQVTDRAVKLELNRDDHQSLLMDLVATHANGCRINFDKLLKADDFTFAHDVGGIQKNLVRETGRLANSFFPRCHK